MGGSAIATTGTQSGTHYIVPNGVLVSSLPSASDVPIIQNYLYVSDVSRFVFAFGCNDYGSTVQNPMLIRWSDQESVAIWSPDVDNQAGSYRLSQGSEIITGLQTAREEAVPSIFDWCDDSLPAQRADSDLLNPLGKPCVSGYPNCLFVPVGEYR